MMQVIFKNGDRIKISEEMVRCISNKITSEKGSKKWQTFSDQNDKPLLLLNMDEVLTIISPENI